MSRVCRHGPQSPRSSRRSFLGTVARAGTILGAGLVSPTPAHARTEDDGKHSEGAKPNAIPSGVTPWIGNEPPERKKVPASCRRPTRRSERSASGRTC